MIIGHVVYKELADETVPYGLPYCGHPDLIAVILAVCEYEHIREWVACMKCLQLERRHISREHEPYLGGCGHYCQDLIYQYIKKPIVNIHYNDWQGQIYDWTGRKT